MKAHLYHGYVDDCWSPAAEDLEDGRGRVREIDATPEQVIAWTAAWGAWEAAQKEMDAAVVKAGGHSIIDY